MPALGVLPTFPFGDQVVELAFQQVSGVVEFSATVPAEATDTYVRIIALWHDNQSLGAEFPTIGIRSGQGGLTPLTVTRLGTPSQAVPIIGTGGAQAGSATCVAEDGDIYFIHIADPDLTSRPWMVWGATPNSFSTVGDPDALTFALPGLFSSHTVTVRNLGTGTLQFGERAGISIGAPDSPVVISTMPEGIAPHGVADIVFGVHQGGAEQDVTIHYAMHPSDPIHGAALSISVRRTEFPPPAPGVPCNVDRCAGYIPPRPYPPALGATNSGVCVQPGCVHDENFHGLGPECQQSDNCPGFLDSTGRRIPPSLPSSDVCVQPGCGHDYKAHLIFHPPEPDSSCRKKDGCQAFIRGSDPTHDVCRRPGCGHSFQWHTDDHPEDF
jgi:hypothetical protein